MSDLNDDELRFVHKIAMHGTSGDPSDDKPLQIAGLELHRMTAELQRRRAAERANADNDGFTTRQMVAVGKALLKYLKPDATHADITAAAFNVCQAYRHSMRPLPAPPGAKDE